MSTMEGALNRQQPLCPHCVFGLLVTGKGERDFLPPFFRLLMERAGCSFQVIGRIGQRTHITSQKKILLMVGSGKTIPDKDEEEIGIPARRFLSKNPCRFVVLIDDVEEARRPDIARIFERYRKALDTLLQPAEQQRASVHFLANMLEAYYFADSGAVNRALGAMVLDADYNGEVEFIRHPKNELKRLFPGFDERAHGASIVPLLNTDHILDNPQTCAFLRSLFDWCVQKLHAHCNVWVPDLEQSFQLQTGIREPLTSNQ